MNTTHQLKTDQVTASSQWLLACVERVRRRMWWNACLGPTAVGLCTGAVISLLFALARLSGTDVAGPLILASPLVGGLAGVCIGLLKFPSTLRAAGYLDQRGGLKDAVSSACQFIEAGIPSDLHQAQIEQTTDRLRSRLQVDTRLIPSIRIPGLIWLPIACMLLTVFLLTLPRSRQADHLVVDPSLRVIREQQAAVVQDEVLEEMKALVNELEGEQLPIEPLRETVQDLEQKLAELTEAKSEKEALIRLSEIEAVLKQLQGKFDDQAIELDLKSLGEAVAPADSLQDLAKALQEGEFDKASEQLEQFDPDQLSEAEKKAVSEELERLAATKEQLEKPEDPQEQSPTADEKPVGESPSEVKEAAKDLSQGLKDDDAPASQQAAERLAGVAKSQAMRQQIGKNLSRQLAAVAAAKASGRRNGGRSVVKSNRSSQNWGRGASQKPLGDQATKIESKRQRENLKGTQGEGPSEKETIFEEEGEGEVKRALQDRFEEYQRMSEAVLDREPLPLGHRQLIRQYFEAIRPSKEQLKSSGARDAETESR